MALNGLLLCRFKVSPPVAPFMATLLVVCARALDKGLRASSSVVVFAGTSQVDTNVGGGGGGFGDGKKHTMLVCSGR